MRNIKIDANLTERLTITLIFHLISETLEEINSEVVNLMKSKSELFFLI